MLIELFAHAINLPQFQAIKTKSAPNFLLDFFLESEGLVQDFGVVFLWAGGAYISFGFVTYLVSFFYWKFMDEFFYVLMP